MPRARPLAWGFSANLRGPESSRLAGSGARGMSFREGGERNQLKPQLGAFSLLIGPTDILAGLSRGKECKNEDARMVK